MAMTKTHSSGTPIGSNREDLSDILTILNLSAHLCFHSLKKEKPMAHSLSGK